MTRYYFPLLSVNLQSAKFSLKFHTNIVQNLFSITLPSLLIITCKVPHSFLTWFLIVYSMWIAQIICDINYLSLSLSLYIYIYIYMNKKQKYSVYMCFALAKNRTVCLINFCILLILGHVYKMYILQYIYIYIYIYI